MTFVIAALRGSLILCALGTLLHSPRCQAYAENLRATKVLVPVPAMDRLGKTELFSRLAARREWERTHIIRLSAVRSYNVKTNKGKKLATEIVFVEYRAPDQETFTTRSGKGSEYIRGHVFRGLMKFEADKIRHGKGGDNAIAPQNYDLKLMGEDTIGGSECLIVRTIPRRKERDLFQGTIWIDKRTFAIIKASGDLAKNPSFWVKHVHFVRDYLRVGDFWLPSREQAVSQIRIFGQETLTVDYYDYSINGATPASQTSGRPVPSASQ